RERTPADNHRRVARALRQLGDSREILLGRGEVPECRAQDGAPGYAIGGIGQLTPLEGGVGVALHERQRIAIRADPVGLRMQAPGGPPGLERGPPRPEDVPPPPTPS